MYRQRKRNSVLYLLCLGTSLSILFVWYASVQHTSTVMDHQDARDSEGMGSLANPVTLSPNNGVEDFKYGCEKKHCAEYLTAKEKMVQKKCMQEVFRHMDPLNIRATLRENNCRFINGRHRLPVALVSAEGSGNTWLRGLLEQATGLCTGFVHCDYVMRKNGFIGEAVKSGNVLVVKTHAVEPQWNGVRYSEPNQKQPFFGSGILMIRNPFKSLVAEWNRRVTNLYLIPNGIEHNESHTNIIPREYWMVPEWDSYIHVYIQAWKERILNWIDQDHAEVLVVYYEDLKRNTLTEIIRIMDFLELDYPSSEEIGMKLSKDFTEFKRPHTRNENFEYYTPEQKHYIKLVIEETDRELKRANKKLELASYLKAYQ